MEAVLTCSRVDLANATTNLKKPRFGIHRSVPPTFSLDEEKEFHSKLDGLWGLHLPTVEVKSYEGMDTLQNRIFHRLRQLSALTPAFDKPDIDPDLQLMFTRGMLILEDQVTSSVWSVGLNGIRQHGSSTHPRAPAANRACARTWHISLAVYLYIALRMLPPNARCLAKLVDRCKVSLEKCSANELWVDFPPKFLFWVLLIAGSASAEEIARIWFGELLIGLCERLKIRDWEKAREIAEEFVWAESRCGKACKVFWEDTMARGSRERHTLVTRGPQ